jgi:hypothetical protein
VRGVPLAGEALGFGELVGGHETCKGVASVAVDLRIGQLVDAPNVGVTALLPLDIFTER